MKLIDSDKILEALGMFTDEKYGNPHFMNGIATVLELIEDMPEAVVRCKDCAIAQHDELFGQWYCNGKEVKPDGFCSHGERRTDEAQ